jgi:hypothetical protein
VDEREGTAHSGATVTGTTARALAVRLAEHGYRVIFPAGRDPAVFKLTGLPGDPDVEVTAEDNGPAACPHTGSNLTEAATVIARLAVPARSPAQAASDAVIAAWDGVEIEWHYLTSPGQPAGAEQVAVALLSHISVLAGWSGGSGAAPAAGARGASRG